MKLSELTGILQKINGNTYPIVFETPDGLRWDASRVEVSQKLDTRTEIYSTVVKLVPEFPC